MRLALLNVSRHRGDVIVSYRSLAPIASLGVRLPFNDVIELSLGVEGGLVIDYSESPGESGMNFGGGLVLGADLKARIWMSSRIAIAFDARFDLESVSFDGAASRMLPAVETLVNATSVSRDLRTSIGVAFRL